MRRSPFYPVRQIGTNCPNIDGDEKSSQSGWGRTAASGVGRSSYAADERRNKKKKGVTISHIRGKSKKGVLI